MAILDWLILYPIPLESTSKPRITLNLSRCLCSKIELKIKSTENEKKIDTNKIINKGDLFVLGYLLIIYRYIIMKVNIKIRLKSNGFSSKVNTKMINDKILK